MRGIKAEPEMMIPLPPLPSCVFGLALTSPPPLPPLPPLKHYRSTRRGWGGFPLVDVVVVLQAKKPCPGNKWAAN